MKVLPIHFDSSAPPEEQQRQMDKLEKLIIESLVADYEKDKPDPDAWFHLLLHIITRAGIPESTKAKLRRRLIQVFNGEVESIDPYSRDKRIEEKLNEDIYSAMMRVGGNVTTAAKEVGRQFGISDRTAMKRYNAHIERWPDCERLDGRSKKKQ